MDGVWEEGGVITEDLGGAESLAPGQGVLLQSFLCVCVCIAHPMPELTLYETCSGRVLC